MTPLPLERTKVLQPSIEQAKRDLGVDRLVLQIHDASFPADAEEDLGRGSPYSHAADRFMRFVASLGFDTIQLGPRGLTSRGNPSPYDGTIFSRNPLDLPLLRMVEQGRLSRATFESLRMLMSEEDLRRVANTRVFDAYEIALREIVTGATKADWDAASDFLIKNEEWLVPDCLYDPLCAEHGNPSWFQWNRTTQGEFDQRLFAPLAGHERAAADRFEALRSRYADRIHQYALVQWLLFEQHRAFRERLSELKLAVYGDLQVGMSLRDAWVCQHLFLPGYRMGAPPSRTNPDGQPWGYAVLDPEKLGTLQSPGPALQFVRARIRKVLHECDGLRIDHPHGWVDPWVYRADDANPFHAVQSRARLFSSPDDASHPALSQYAIARAEQLNRSEPPYADERVRELDAAQVAHYALLLDTISELQSECGRPTGAVACEVLSTLPYQVGRALSRHNLGRFRVTQKIKHDNPSDVYRIEHAAAADWVMLGTHDTAPIWKLAQNWCGGEEGVSWGRYLAQRLVVEAERPAVAASIAEHPSELVHALFAAMLGSQARHVVVFFPDLFGMQDRYNAPGVISEANWSLRVPYDFEELYANRRARGEALDISRCLQMALDANRVSNAAE